MALVKKLVSKNKRRYREDGFDLDLTYIYPNIIAMGFPAEKLEGVYRNHIDDVIRFLDTKHKDHYRVYNLCSERVYDGKRFHGRVVMFPFDDHSPPTIELFEPFCIDLDTWLSADVNNVAAIHCKAGKGRTGVMICAYMLHRKKYAEPKIALDFYGRARTRDGKGVTIPSQRRYVEYYGELVKTGRKYEKKSLLLSRVKFNTVPHLNNGTCNVFFDIYSNKVKLASSSLFETHKHDRELIMVLPTSVMICGDICIEFFHKPSRIGMKERIFQCWFNTFFVNEVAECREPQIDVTGCIVHKFLALSMPKTELDKANKDKDNKIYDKDFKVIFYFDYPIEGEYITTSRTEDNILAPAESSRGNKNGNIATRPVFYDNSRDKEGRSKSNLPTATGNGGVPGIHISPEALQQIKLTSTAVPDGPVYNKPHHPPSSMSLPNMNNVTEAKQGHRNRKVSPFTDRRRGGHLGELWSPLDVVSDPESLSDSETDDEWAGCPSTEV